MSSQHSHDPLNIHPISLKRIGIIYVLIAAIVLTAQFCNRAWGAELLEGISFEPLNSGINVVLQTTSNPPYRVVFSDDKKATLVIENVDISPRLATDVTQMSNIRYVAAKPIGEHTLQVDIYGENLGHPFVTSSADTPMAMAAMVQDIPNPPGFGSKNAKPSSSQHIASALQSVATPNTAPEATAEQAYDLTSLDSSIENLPLPPVETTVKQQGTLHQFPNQSVTKEDDSIFSVSPAVFFSKLTQKWHNEYLFILALCIGAGLLFVFALGAAVNGIKQLITNQQDILQIGQPAQQTQTRKTKKGGKKQQKGANNIITTLLLRLKKFLIPNKTRRQLSAFQRMQGLQQGSAAVPANLSSGKTLPQSMQPSIRPSMHVEQQVARQQAQNAYRAQQKPQPREQWRGAGQGLGQKDSALEREMRRSLEMKYAMGPRYEKPTPQPKAPQRPSAQPKTPTAYQPNTGETSKQANKPPISPTVANSTTSNMGKLNSPGSKVPDNNHDVVNFLKSVADLMEKDGKANLANEIKKTLQ